LAQPITLGADIPAGHRIGERLGGVGQPVGPAPQRQRALLEPGCHHSRDHGDQYPPGPPGKRGRRGGSGTGAGVRAIEMVGFGLGAGFGFARWRTTGRSAFGSGSGRGSARFIRASVFAAQRQSDGVPAANTGPLAAGCSSRR
jgi:hypothetical protein